jgi:archaeal chaperonin
VYDGLYNFDKSIMVIRKTNMEDKVVNGIVLERKRLDPEMPLDVKGPKIMIVKLDLKPVKESWLKENTKYQDILTMENDRLVKAKQIVDSIVATGANTVMIASPEIDQVVEDLLVAKKVFAVRISTEEIEHLSRYTGAKPVRLLEDLKKPGILGNSRHVYEDEQDELIYVETGSNQNMVTIIVSGSTKETSQERWRAVLDGINAAEAALNSGVVAGGGSAELHIIEKVKKLRLKGLEQVGLDVVMSALESIMRQILTNAGFNGLEKVMAARSSPEGFGIDINTGEPVDMWKIGIIDPLLVKTMALKAAGEIAKSVLRIDRNLAAEDLSPQAVSETKR